MTRRSAVKLKGRICNIIKHEIQMLLIQSNQLKSANPKSKTCELIHNVI